ncbi:MAG: hypothetical protein CYPHOPRED_005784 [Cyphobasidiales sp. Tagirdzhanova-0007]|nr:MAG: hypothetical protein CYPHOPRED_005784 [Cyphobasidiales sp. Tagirdzhanova-0007]
MSSDALVHAAAGAAGGMVAMTITYPLISISTRAQVQGKSADESILTTVRRIVKSEGISGLYSGIDSSLMAIGVTNYLYYLAFEECRAIILRGKAKVAGKNAHTLNTIESIFASCIAGCATSLVSNPIWVVNTRQTVQASLDDAGADESIKKTRDPKTGETKIIMKLGFLQTVLKIYRKDGLLAFFRGLGPALVLVINPVIAYTAFEQLKNWIVARRSASGSRFPTGTQSITSKPTILPLSDLDNFLLGAVTKLLATGLTYPYLVVKSRMQAGAAQGRRYKNTFHGLATIIREEGFGHLYNGIGSKLVQSVLTAAFLFASKERIYLLTTKASIRKTAKALPSV